jgi:hypothetical protein
MPAIIGTIAQEGQAGGGGGGGGGGEPTSVSLATASSGNYNNACIIVSPDNDGVGNEWIDEDGSNFSGSAINQAVERTFFQGSLANSGGTLRLMFNFYVRATGATSFSTELNSLDISGITSGTYNDISISGSADTGQDNTGTGAFAMRINFEHPSGGRGFLMPANGDTMTVDLEATATNSSGDTTVELDVGFNWTG